MAAWLALSLALALAVPAGVLAQDARAVTAAPRWSASLGARLEWLRAQDGGVVTGIRGHFERRDLASGDVTGRATVPGEGALHFARAGERFGVSDPSRAPGPHGDVGMSFGGTGATPLDLVFSLDGAGPSVRWQLPTDGRAATALAERDGLVLLDWSDRSGVTVLAVEASSGRARWRAALPGAPEVGGDLLADASGVYYASYEGVVAALDVADGRIRWRQRIAARAPSSAVRDARLVAGTLVLAGSTSAWALDGATGRELWRVPGTEPLLENLGPSAVAVQSHGAELVVLDVHTGRAVGATRIEGAHAIERRGDFLLVPGERELAVLDAATGRELRRFATDRPATVVVDGRRVFALVGARPDAATEPALSSARLAGFDVDTGAQWRSSRTLSPASPVVVSADVVAACSDGGVVHGFDGESGAALWRVSIGRVGDGPDPCRIFRGDPSTLLAVGALDTLHALDVHPRAARVAALTVRGRVVGPGSREGIRVLVGDTETRTDGTGAFSARIRSAAAITVQADPRTLPRCTSSTPIHLAVHAARSRPVTLRYAVDYCLCHACD